MAEKDLIPFNQRSKEEVKRLNTLGGINSGKTRRKKRDLKKRIAATWELATDMKRKELQRLLKELPIDETMMTDEQKINSNIIKDKIKVLGVGGVEMLTLMEIIMNEKVSAMTKAITIDNLFAHEFGKPKGNDTVSVVWGSGAGISPAFSGDSVLMGIKHGLAKLNIQELQKVTEMVEIEKNLKLGAKL